MSPPNDGLSFVEAWEKGRWDGKYWAKRFLNIDIHPGQERLFEAALARRKGARWWVAAYLTICLSAGNRAGKTLIMALVILHSAFYKTGLQPPETPEEWVRWRSHPYVWYHFAIQQDVARLVFDEITNMMQGIHVAQKDGGCPLADEQGQMVDWSKKDGGEYDYITLAPDWGGAQIKFRTTQGSKGKGSLGRDMHGISFDEAGIEPNLRYIYKNVLHLRRLGTAGQLFFFSTPEEGLTEFADFWFEGDPDQIDRKPRHMSLRMSTRDNVGYGLQAEDFEALVADMDPDHIKQNIDGFFIEGKTNYFSGTSVDKAFKDDLLEVTPPVDGARYIQGVDPGLTDKCWSIVLRYRGGKLYGVKAEFSRTRTVEAIVALAVNNHRAYQRRRAGEEEIGSTCLTAVDTTALGGHMFRDLVRKSIPNVVSVEFGGNTIVKRKMLSNLKTMLDKGQIIMPRTGDWALVRSQLGRYKLADRHIENDAVMALAVAVKQVQSMPSDNADASADFDIRLAPPVEPEPTGPGEDSGQIKSEPMKNLRAKLNAQLREKRREAIEEKRDYAAERSARMMEALRRRQGIAARLARPIDAADERRVS